MAATVNGVDHDELQAMAAVIRTRFAVEPEWERFDKQELDGLAVSIGRSMLKTMDARLSFALHDWEAEADEVGE